MVCLFKTGYRCKRYRREVSKDAKFCISQPIKRQDIASQPVDKKTRIVKDEWKTTK